MGASIAADPLLFQPISPSPHSNSSLSSPPLLHPISIRTSHKPFNTHLNPRITRPNQTGSILALWPSSRLPNTTRTSLFPSLLRSSRIHYQKPPRSSHRAPSQGIRRPNPQEGHHRGLTPTPSTINASGL